MSDLLTENRRQIKERMRELKPVHEEYIKLDEADAALDRDLGPLNTPSQRKPKARAKKQARKR